MHAASVNPEPGSNSLKNCILVSPRWVNTFFRAIFTSLSYLITCLYFVNSKCFNEIFRTFQCLKNFNVVQFSMIKCFAGAKLATLLSKRAQPLYPKIQYLSSSFFKKSWFFLLFLILACFTEFKTLVLYKMHIVWVGLQIKKIFTYLYWLYKYIVL